MLSDFALIKGELDIVAKSFVTRGKPFLFHNVNVHVRDTVLLAPSGSKGLEALGRSIEINKKGLKETDKKSTLRVDLKKENLQNLLIMVIQML
jgi:hypothetical protein